MKFLLDENIPTTIKKILSNNGYDVEHTNQKLKGKTDREVFDYAVKNKRCIITYDSDFNDFKEKKHYGIIKIEQISTNHQQKLLNVIKEEEKSRIEDIYIYIGRAKIYKEIKKYAKKSKKIKQFQRINLKMTFI